MLDLSQARPPVRPMRLMIILGSVRPQRVGLSVALWAHELVSEAADIEIDFVDLAELDLPFMDEPRHPEHQQYTKRHTKAWSARVQAADAFLLISPEYNFGYSPALKNALDFLHHEWAGKPVGIVGYGGPDGGTSGVAALRPVLASLRLVGTAKDITIPDVAGQVDDGCFEPTESQRLGLLDLLADLRWLRPIASTDKRSLSDALT